MAIDNNKLQRQLIGLDKFLNSSKYGSFKDCVGTLNYCTGVGKTFTAIMIRKKLLELNKDFHTIVLVPSENLKNQWEEELDKHFKKKELINLEVYTSHYLVENKIKIKTNFLIVDELHEFYTEERLKLIDKTYIKYDKILGLTATYEDVKKSYKIVDKICPVIDIITEEEAIEKGFISNYIEFNLGLNLTEEEQSLYDDYTKIISTNLPKFNGDLSLVNKVLSGGKINGITYTSKKVALGWAIHKGWRNNLNLSNEIENEINNLWNPGKIIYYAKKLMNAIRARKDILYSSENKVKATVSILQKYDNVKSIVFSQSTSFADRVGDACNELNPNSAVVYHSKLNTIMLPSEVTGKLIKYGKQRLKKRALDFLQKGKAKSIITASSLDKGFNVEDIRLGVIASGTQNPTQHTQRSGRVKRKEIFNPNVIVLIINLYIKDSKDHTWLIKRQSKSNNIIYWVNSINEITFNPQPNEVFTSDDI